MSSSIVQKLYKQLVATIGFNGSLRVVDGRYVAYTRSWSEHADLGPTSYGVEAAFDKAVRDLSVAYTDELDAYGLEG